MNRNRSILWALLLIGLGVVLLLREAGVLPAEVTWWPVILLALGLWILADRLFGRRGHPDFVMPLVLIAIGLVFFLHDVKVVSRDVELWPIVLVAVGLGIALSAVPFGGRGPEPRTISVPLDGATSGRVAIKHGAGRLSVTSTSDPAVLLEGTVPAAVEPGERRSGDELDVTLRPGGGWFRWDHGRSLDWWVRLTRAVPLRLQVDAGANRADLDLADLSIRDLRVNTGASDTSITMPAHGVTDAFVTCGAASVRIRIPEGTAARVSVRAGLMSVKVDQARFPAAAEGYASPGFEQAGDRVDLRIEGGAASVEVR